MARRIRTKIKKNLNLNAELISDDTSFFCVIDTITSDDIHLKTSLEQGSLDIEKELKLKIQLPSDETIDLLCSATCFHIHNHPTYGLINDISLKVSAPSGKYKKFLSLS